MPFGYDPDQDAKIYLLARVWGGYDLIPPEALAAAQRLKVQQVNEIVKWTIQNAYWQTARQQCLDMLLAQIEKDADSEYDPVWQTGR